MACLDLLLRWCVLRVVESNTQSLVKVTDMLKAIMDAMTQAEVRWVKHSRSTLSYFPVLCSSNRLVFYD